MNILIFSPVRSHPQNAGNCKRIFNFTKYLQKMGHTIHFVYYTQSGLDKKSFDDMQNEWESLTIINKTKSIRKSTEGYELDEWYQEDIHPIVNEVIDLFNIDAILVNYIMQSKLLEFVPDNVLKIIDTHDIFGDRHLHINAHVSYEYTWYSVSRPDEIKALNRADTILAIQNKEAEYFSSIIDRPVKVINHLEDNNFLDRSYKKLKKIGFIGSLNDMNNTSIHNFLELYINHNISNETQIIIVGTVCRVIKASHKSIILKGVIDNLEEFYSEVDLVINLVTFGTGLNIKSIEALSYGVPIISTEVGFKGIDSDSKYHQLHTQEEMIECIEDIYRKPEVLSSLSKLSMEIFSSYETNVKREMESLFDTKKDHLNSDLTISDSPKQKKIISKLYRQLQISIFEQKEEKKKDDLQTKELLKQNQKLIAKVEHNKKDLHSLLQAIQGVVQLPIKEHPVKKYQAYKAMLKIFFNIKTLFDKGV